MVSSMPSEDRAVTVRWKHNNNRVDSSSSTPEGHLGSLAAAPSARSVAANTAGPGDC